MQEYLTFLAGQPPFDALDPAELERLGAGLEVEFVAAGEQVRPQGRPWVIRAGAVELREGDRTVDLLQAGDLVRLPEPGATVVVAVAVEDTLGFRLASLFEPPRPASAQAQGSAQVPVAAVRGLQPVARFARPVVRCRGDLPVRDAARLITEAGQSCILVEPVAGSGLGIVTDHDLRRRVATGEVAIDAPVQAVASSPVLTHDSAGDVAGALLGMVEHGVHHLVLMDGERPTGVVRLVDLASAEVRDPMAVRAAVASARTVPELVEATRTIPSTAVELLDAGLPALRISALLSAVTEAAVRRMVELLPLGGPRDEPDVPTVSWLLLGSIARREQLPGSDLDTALAWHPSAGMATATATAGGHDQPATRVREHAARVLDALAGAGLTRCPEGVNADSARFARALVDWRAAAEGWVRSLNAEDALLLSTLIADSRAVTEPELGAQVARALLAAPRPPQYLHALLGYTLASRPPTGFVRDFVVEHSGEHRGELDLKRGGLRPLTALARWVAVSTADPDGGTPQRLRRAVPAGLLSQDESDDLAGSFELIFELVLTGEVEALRSGRPISTYLDPRDLDRLTRRQLRDAFRAIARVQDRLGSGFSSPIPGLPPGLR